MASGAENNPPWKGEGQYRRNRKQKGQISFRKPEDPVTGKPSVQSVQGAADPTQVDDNKTLRELVQLHQLGAMGASMGTGARAEISQPERDDQARDDEIHASLQREIQRRQGEHLEERMRETLAFPCGEEDDLETMHAQMQQHMAKMYPPGTRAENLDPSLLLQTMKLREDLHGRIQDGTDNSSETSSSVTSPPKGESAHHRHGVKKWVPKHEAEGYVAESENTRGKADGGRTGGPGGSGKNLTRRQGKSAKKDKGSSRREKGARMREGRTAQREALEILVKSDDDLMKDPANNNALRYASSRLA